jgi:hypothetical protein
MTREKHYIHFELFERIDSSTELKECVIKYLFSAALYCAYLPIRVVRFDGRLLNILMPA